MILRDGDRDVVYYIGNKIRYYRKIKSLSIAKLAALTDIDPTYLTRIEKGSNLSVIVLCRILKELGVDAEDVLPEEFFRFSNKHCEDER